MAWLLILAVLTVALVALAIWRSPDRPGFPWFWLAFPATCFAIAATLGTWITAAPTDFSSTVYVAGYAPYADDPSHDSINQILAYRRALWLLPILSVIGIGLSIWTWRLDRKRAIRRITDE